MLDKKALRKEYARLRESCTEAQADALTDNLLSLREYKNAKSIFIYAAAKSEPDTRAVIYDAVSSGKDVCLPKCNISDKAMKFIRITSFESDLKKGAYGILEPISDAEYESTPDLIIVPALSCDRFGNRLGYGGGYYDRYLKKYKGSTVIAAYIYDCLLSDGLPYEKTDIPVDMIITESRILRIR